MSRAKPLTDAFVPYGMYWSSPFCRWQGALGGENSVKLAAQTAQRFLGQRDVSPEKFDQVSLGITVPQHRSFYGAPWLAGMIGAGHATGSTISQACATSARAIADAALGVQYGASESSLVIACDRTSNGPHLYYPNPNGIGGRGETEEWVWDNFNHDPHAKNAMLDTAENVAADEGISREEQDEMVLLRHRQYEAALANDRSFQRRYLFPIELRRGKKTMTVEEDEGVFPTSPEGLAKLRPVKEGGTVTFGGQTYPADGNAGIVVCSKERARELQRDDVTVQILGYGQARVEPGRMPKAPVPAAERALAAAGITIGDVKAIKSHNPFAVNDIYFCRQMGVSPDQMNNYGSPLIYGHPQGPTGMRVVIEMIEELAKLGGGYGLFTGCAAGDTSMALTVKVS